MKLSLGRNWGRATWALAWLLLGGAAMGQVPEQHWPSAPDSPPSYPPNYQSTAQGAAPAPGNPAAGAAAGQYQYQNPRQPDQPVGPPQYPIIERRQPEGAAPQAYGNQPPDNRMAYPPQDPRAPGMAGQGLPVAGPPVTGPPVQGPAGRNGPPPPPFVLSPAEAAGLDNFLNDWEKRNKEIHILESKFYRWKYDAVFGNGHQPVPEEGILKFASPDKGLMKIEAKDPKQSEQWLCDGKSIYQFDYPRKRVTEYVMPPELQGKGIGDGPLPFVFGVEAQKLKQRYFMRIITPPNARNEVWLEAYPRYHEQAADFSRIEVILQIAGPTKALVPFAIQLYASNKKDHMVYQLQDPVINPPKSWLPMLGPDWWKPSIPWGWEKKTELPPPPVNAGLSPSRPPRR